MAEQQRLDAVVADAQDLPAVKKIHCKMTPEEKEARKQTRRLLRAAEQNAAVDRRWTAAAPQSRRGVGLQASVAREQGELRNARGFQQGLYSCTPMLATANPTSPMHRIRSQAPPSGALCRRKQVKRHGSAGKTNNPESKAPCPALDYKLGSGATTSVSKSQS